jgi:hypothetical protein
MPNHVRPALLIIALVLASSRNANAVVVLECHVGDRPDDASRTIVPLRRAFGAYGVTARPSAIRARLRYRDSRPGILNPALTISDLTARIDAATKLLNKSKNEGDIKAARDAFEAALGDAYANVAMLVDNRARSQKAMMDLLVGLAVSRQRLKDTAGAASAFQELARSYPNQDQAIQNGYGMEPAQNYRRAEKELDQRGRGTMVVTVSDPSALIFTDEWDRPQNATFEADVLPGIYRVFVQLPGTRGRLYYVVVEPKQKVRLEIDAAFDAAVTVTDAWVGLTFLTMAAARAHLVDYARRLVPSDEREVMVVSHTRWNDRPAVVGSVYRLDTGAHARSRLVVLGGRDEEFMLSLLAQVLATPDTHDQVAKGYGMISVPDPFGSDEAVAAPRATQHAPSGAKWWLAGSALVTAAGGGLLVYADNRGTCEASPDCKYVVRTAPYGYVSLSVAGLMALAAGYLFYRDRPSTGTTVGVMPTTTGAFLSVAGSF